MGICDRLSEFQKVKSGIVAGRHLEKWRNRSQGFPESRVICGLGFSNGEFDKFSTASLITRDMRSGDSERVFSLKRR